jgi:hypothetical protein
MVFKFLEIVKDPSVAALMSSTVTPSASSIRTRPDGVTSKTHNSVIILLTTPFPVNGRLHCFKILCFPFAVCFQRF